MKKLKMLSIFLMMLFLATSCDDTGNNGIFNCECGEGDIVSQTLNINEFTGVKLRGSSKVFITQGNDFQVIVEGQQNIIDLIELDIQDNIWEIEFEECIRDYEKLNFYITIPDITRLEVSGSGDIVGQNAFNADVLQLKVDGSGEVDVEIENAETVETKIEGSGKIKVKGQANDSENRISGSGDLRAFDLEVLTSYVKITGSGDAEVNASDELKVKITGSGNVYYKGNPAIDVDITGTGDLVNAN